MTPKQLAAEARERIRQRAAYELDIGGVRSREEFEIVKRIITAEKRRLKPRLKLAA